MPDETFWHNRKKDCIPKRMQSGEKKQALLLRGMQCLLFYRE